MIAGELDFSVGDERRTVTAGAAVFAPRGVPHSFANPFGNAARMLAVWSPGGIEEMYRAWEQAFSGPADFDLGRFVEIWREFDTTPVPE